MKTLLVLTLAQGRVKVLAFLNFFIQYISVNKENDRIESLNTKEKSESSTRFKPLMFCTLVTCTNQ